MKRILLVAIFFILTSCSHMMRSGKYVQVSQKDQGIEKLAKKYSVKSELLKRHNPNARFVAGDWVFIPVSSGLSSYYESYNNPYYEVVGQGEFIWPVPSSQKVSSHYGMRKGKHHDGIDIPAPVGTHILSAKEGVIIYADKRIGGYGNMVIVKHENNIYSVYAHARKLFVSRGDRVSKGQVIGQVGMTGRTSGPHLHFEIRVGDNPKNPLAFIGASSGKFASK